MLFDLEEQIRKEEPKRYKSLTRYRMINDIIREAKNDESTPKSDGDRSPPKGS
jgi:hypothetical protein